MTGTIQTDSGVAGELATSVSDFLAGYLGFSLTLIEGDAPVEGSTDHDGFQGDIRDALTAWSELIASDAKALVDADADFTSQDNATAKGLLGVDSELS